MSTEPVTVQQSQTLRVASTVSVCQTHSTPYARQPCWGTTSRQCCAPVHSRTTSTRALELLLVLVCTRVLPCSLVSSSCADSWHGLRTVATTCPPCQRTHAVPVSPWVGCPCTSCAASWSR